MTRMVEDQRIQIGTLKALGYSSKAITGKYFIYSFLAGIIGCTVGLVVGIFLFPSLIYMAYGAMYPALPDLFIPYHGYIRFWQLLQQFYVHHLFLF